MNASKKERPSLDCMGPYNVPASDLPDYDGEAWAENEKIKPLAISEFYKVRAEVVAALSKHGEV